MRRRLLPTLLGLVIVLLLAGMRLYLDPYPFQVARDVAFDTFQRIKPREAPGPSPVKVVDIDEASLAQLGQWPWPRNMLATLTNRLTELGAVAVAYDVLFAEPDRLSPSRLGEQVPGLDTSGFVDNDLLFAEALQRSPSILGFSDALGASPMSGKPKSGFAISGTDPSPALAQMHGAVVPLPGLREAAHGLGSISLERNQSAAPVRRVPLLWADAAGQIFPTFSIEAMRVALGLDTLIVMGGTTSDHFVEGVRIASFEVPTTGEGELWLYYRAPDPSLYVSAAAILGDNYRDLAPEIGGRIVLIGTSASGLLDIRRTALGTEVPGVAIHAEAIDQIFYSAVAPAQFLTRADWVQGLEVLAFVITGLILVVVVLRLGPVAGLLAGLLLMGGMLVASWQAFAAYGWLIDPTFPIGASLLIYGTMVYFQFASSDRDRRQVRRAFGYYVAPELLTEIEKNAGRLTLGGELKEITVMFSDMRGFTSFTEKHTPQDTLHTLNTLFGALGKEIVDRYGTIDKFIGDAIMAFWNAPVDVPNHARKGALSAIAMRETLDAMNENKVFGDPGLAVGVGLCTGVALVGNMGLETRFDYSTIGDPVNVASRVESESKVVGYDIVAAEPTAVASPELAWLEAGSVALKGKAQRLKIYILVGNDELAKSEAFQTLKAAHKALLEALRSGEGGEALKRCRELGPGVEKRLAHFYELVPDRISDFLSAA